MNKMQRRVHGHDGRGEVKLRMCGRNYRQGMYGGN